MTMKHLSVAVIGAVALLGSPLLTALELNDSLNLNGYYMFTDWKPGIDNATFVGDSDTRFDFGFVAGGHLEGYASTDPEKPGEFRVIFGGGPEIGKVVFNHYDGAGTWRDRVAIHRDGSMTVEGVLTSSEIVVQQEVWPDYVLAEDYNLMPLSDVRAYIEAKGHLPGVPSAVRVKEEGVNVGDMSRILLEKVEELTLHVIALKEENDLLKQRIDAMGSTDPKI